MQLGRPTLWPWDPAFFVLASTPPPGPQRTQLRSPRFLPQARLGSVPNQRLSFGSQGSLSPREGPPGRPASHGYLPVPSEQAVNCFCFPLQWLLCQPCRGAAEDSRHHSLPSLLSLASGLGQRTLKPLQLLGLAHLSLVCGHGAGYHRRRQLCGPSGHHDSPIPTGQGRRGKKG